MERVNYGGWNYDDYDDDEELEFDGHGQVEHREGHQDNYQPETSQGPDNDLDYADGNGKDDFQDQYDLTDQVEHLVEFAEDGSGQTDYEARFGRKSKASRRRRGPFRPPNRRSHRTPVFVKVKDLQERIEKYVPEHYDDPDDEELAAILIAQFHRNPDGH